jgi:hypothetical protein
MDAARVLKAITVDRFSSLCEGQAIAREWYERNISVWDADKIATHAPPDVARAPAAIALEGAPDCERGRDCWSVEISEDPWCSIGSLAGTWSAGHAGSSSSFRHQRRRIRGVPGAPPGIEN